MHEAIIRIGLFNRNKTAEKTAKHLAQYQTGKQENTETEIIVLVHSCFIPRVNLIISPYTRPILYQKDNQGVGAYICQLCSTNAIQIQYYIYIQIVSARHSLHCCIPPIDCPIDCSDEACLFRAQESNHLTDLLRFAYSSQRTSFHTLIHSFSNLVVSGMGS